MATERLVVKNFGPIKDIDIEVKDVNVLIGTTGSGKSTVAKLLAIFKSNDFWVDVNGKEEYDLKFWLKRYDIDFEIKESTAISYSVGNLFIEFSGIGLKTNIDFEELMMRNLALAIMEGGKSENRRWYKMIAGLWAMNINGNRMRMLEKRHGIVPDLGGKDAVEKILKTGLVAKYDAFSGLDKGAQLNEFDRLNEKYCGLESFRHSSYFPAERILISMVGSSIMGLLKNDVAIADCVKEFGSAFENARKGMAPFSIDFLGIEFNYENNENLITIEGSHKLKLEKTSSGIQSIVPLMVVLESFKNQGDENGGKNDGYFIVVEEPETNLYPTTQKQLTQYIVKVASETDSKLFITTHSPYILTALDNLVQAHNAYKAHPEKESEIEKIIPKSQWLDFDNVSCYFFDKGTCRSTLNHELRTLGSTTIDDVSIEIGKEFDQLTDIQFA